MRYAPVLLLISTGCATIASAAPLPRLPDDPSGIGGSAPHHSSSESSVTPGDITPRSTGFDAAAATLASSSSLPTAMVIGVGCIGASGVVAFIVAAKCYYGRKKKEKDEEQANERSQENPGIPLTGASSPQRDTTSRSGHPAASASGRPGSQGSQNSQNSQNSQGSQNSHGSSHGTNRDGLSMTRPGVPTVRVTRPDPALAKSSVIGVYGTGVGTAGVGP